MGADETRGCDQDEGRDERREVGGEVRADAAAEGVADQREGGGGAGPGEGGGGERDEEGGGVQAGVVWEEGRGAVAAAPEVCGAGRECECGDEGAGGGMVK